MMTAMIAMMTMMMMMMVMMKITMMMTMLAGCERCLRLCSPGPHHEQDGGSSIRNQYLSFPSLFPPLSPPPSLCLPLLINISPPFYDSFAFFYFFPCFPPLFASSQLKLRYLPDHTKSNKNIKETHKSSSNHSIKL